MIEQCIPGLLLALGQQWHRTGTTLILGEALAELVISGTVVTLRRYRGGSPEYEAITWEPHTQQELVTIVAAYTEGLHHDHPTAAAPDRPCPDTGRHAAGHLPRVDDRVVQATTDPDTSSGGERGALAVVESGNHPAGDDETRVTIRRRTLRRLIAQSVALEELCDTVEVDEILEADPIDQSEVDRRCTALLAEEGSW